MNVLLGGYDTADAKPRLYLVDYLGTLSEVPFASHGYEIGMLSLSCMMRALGLMECGCIKYHNPEATLEEGLETLKRCIDQVAKHVSPGKHKVKVVDKDGVREIVLLSVWSRSAKTVSPALYDAEAVECAYGLGGIPFGAYTVMRLSAGQSALSRDTTRR